MTRIILLIVLTLCYNAEGGMRTTKYKDVLWTIARKAGFSPETGNFPTGQALALGNYIDQWVGREWTSNDWPEWTKTMRVAPDPVTHIVPYEIAGNLTDLPNRPTVRMFRVFDVMLVDPKTTSTPVSTKFYLRPEGVHCGFEHGSYVWIKFGEPPPHFTSEIWSATTVYSKNAVVYVPSRGECFRSKAGGNINNDPTFIFSTIDDIGTEDVKVPLNTDIAQQFVPDNPGLPAQSKLVRVSLLGVKPPPDPDDPPPNLSQWYIPVKDSTGLLGAAQTFSDGVLTKLDILADLTNQLVAALGGFGFTVTKDDGDLTIDISAPQEFTVNDTLSNAMYVIPPPPGGGTFMYKLPAEVIQAYIPGVSNASGTPQEITFGLTDEQVVPGATYNLVFKDNQGMEHPATYTALDTDGPLQILAGLLASVGTLQTSDDFFQDVARTIDDTNTNVTFGKNNNYSIDASLTPPGSAWWEMVLFPEALYNQIVRGGYADILREWGQEDKGLAEEQMVPQESQISVGDFQPTDSPLTNQIRGKSIYRIGDQ